MNIKKIYFKVAFIGKKRRILKNIFIDSYIENKIANNHYAPDAVIGQLKKKNTDFPVLICTKTIYKGIDRGIFATLQIKTYL